MATSLLPTCSFPPSSSKGKVYEAGLRRASLKKSQALDTHANSSPQERVLYQGMGPGYWEQTDSWTRVGTRLTCTVTPSARAAQVPRRHSVASRKVFMAAVPEREEWLVPDATPRTVGLLKTAWLLSNPASYLLACQTGPNQIRLKIALADNRSLPSPHPL